MARKSCIIGEYIIEQLDSGSISIYRVFDNAIGGIREAAQVAGFELNPDWNTRQAGSKLIDYVNEHKGEAVAAVPTFAIDASKTSKDLAEQFNKDFGGVLRVKNGNKRIDGEDIVLSTIGVKSADIEYNDDFTVEDFTNAVKEQTGLTVVVATADNWVAVIPEMPLFLVGNVPNNTTVEKMKQFLTENK